MGLFDYGCLALSFFPMEAQEFIRRACTSGFRKAIFRGLKCHSLIADVYHRSFLN